jgi:DUF971 family protein
MSNATPVSIGRMAAGGVEIAWSDGLCGRYSPRLLRDACPCATCRERRAQPPKPALLPVVGMAPVGRYAYSIEFSDGHSSGIYTLEYLHELAAAGPSAPEKP